jgi:molybdate/tungstate transport system substrate-binding protein
MKKNLLLSLLGVFILAGCNYQTSKKNEIIIFHAGSLSVPFKMAANAYQAINPDIKILLEPAGSLVCARKITELKKPCDIIASADYYVIDELIIPDYADWSIRFATNEMVIGFQGKSKYASEINETNWFEILLREDVIFSRSDPDSDPCGYRAVMTLMLAEKYYNVPGLRDKMTSKNREFIRPKEVDLIALIEANAADYMFQYKSVVIQHNLNYIELPDEINLSDPDMNNLYQTVSLDVAGSSPSEKMKVTGEYINYSLTVLKDAPNRNGSIDFLEFLLSPEGMEIFRKHGQDPIIPLSTGQPELIPEKLSKYLTN